MSKLGTGVVGSAAMWACAAIGACGTTGPSPAGPDGGSVADGGHAGRAADGSADTGIPATPTRLDASCAGSGRAVFPMGVGVSNDQARAVTHLVDGRTVMVGTVDEPVSVESIQSAYFASTRLLADCTTDPSYGSNGLAYFSASVPDYQVEDVQHVRFEPDGAATLFGVTLQTLLRDAGTVEAQPAITAVRVSATGARDQTYGAPFVHVFRDPAGEYPDQFNVRGIYTQADGSTRLLAQTGGPYSSFALLTLRADHTFDPAMTIFAPEGVVAGLDYEAHRVEGLQVLADGATLIAGSFVGNGPTSQLPGVLRLDAAGAVDQGFGAAGVGGAGTAGGAEDVTQVAVQPDGKIVVAGVMQAPGRYESFGVTRLNADGSVDLGFGVQGVARIDVGEGRFAGDTNVHELVQLSLLPSGAILLGGTVHAQTSDEGAPGSVPHVALVRLLPTGALDTSFADGGVFDAALLSAGAEEQLNGFEQDQNGTVSVAATRTLDGNGDWVVYRLTLQP